MELTSYLKGNNVLDFINIGNVPVEKAAALAPMAGVADSAFRRICKRFGAALTVSEMVSAKSILYGDKKSLGLMEFNSSERPFAIQLFGGDPEVMANAAQEAMRFSPDIIDLNMGCPVPKVALNGCGSALMKDAKLAGRIMKAVANAVDIPVTAKFRKGWDDSRVNAVEFAKELEQNGAAALIIHARTRAQMYAPPADLDIIRQVKEAVSVPVIGNGDVTSAEGALEMYNATGCDLVMIGRGALGNPWIFAQVEHYLETGRLLPPPALGERMSLMREHITLLCGLCGEKSGMLQARKHAAWYMRGIKGAARFRQACGGLNSLAKLDGLIEDVMRENAADAAP